jgi:hypothetical protein
MGQEEDIIALYETFWLSGVLAITKPLTRASVQILDLIPKNKTQLVEALKLK